MNRRSAVAIIFWGGLLSLAACQRQQSPFSATDITGTHIGPDFRLADPEGKERTMADFRGQIVMLFFGFTQCPVICPTALARASEVRKRLGPDANRLQVIFVTLDPERDTPGVLKNYMQAFDPGFLGLRGDLKETKQVAEAFQIYYQKVPTGDSYTMDHSADTYVFDPHGRIRLLIRPAQSAKQVTEDLRTLIQNDS